MNIPNISYFILSILKLIEDNKIKIEIKENEIKIIGDIEAIKKIGESFKNG